MKMKTAQQYYEKCIFNVNTNPKLIKYVEQTSNIDPCEYDVLSSRVDWRRRGRRCPAIPLSRYYV